MLDAAWLCPKLRIHGYASHGMADVRPTCTHRGVSYATTDPMPTSPRGRTFPHAAGVDGLQVVDLDHTVRTTRRKEPSGWVERDGMDGCSMADAGKR